MTTPRREIDCPRPSQPFFRRPAVAVERSPSVALQEAYVLDQLEAEWQHKLRAPMDALDAFEARLDRAIDTALSFFEK